MKYGLIPLLLLGFSACAHRPPPQEVPSPEQAMWQEAHEALYQSHHPRADSLFVALAETHPDTPTGREGLYYAAIARLSAGSQGQQLDRAADALRRYLGQPDPQSGNRVAAQLLLDLVGEVRLLHDRSRTAAQEAAALGTRADSLATRLEAETRALQGARAELERIRRMLTGRPERS